MKLIKWIFRKIKEHGINNDCIMPECPYCPACKYGLIIYPDEAYDFPDEDIQTEWRCLYDPEVDGGEEK